MSAIDLSAPLFVFALKQESQGLFDDHQTLYTGVGKVNAAYHLSRHLAHNRPSIIINMGTAGSRKHKAGTIINARSFIQRDMDVTALGFGAFQTPFSDDPSEIEYGHQVKKLLTGSCGSGDNFDTSEAAAQFDVVDMEAYALALIAQRENVPFLCLKYVSDGADDDAGQDWETALQNTARALRKTFDEL